MARRSFLVLLLFICLSIPVVADDPKEEPIRYLRPTTKGFVPEATLTVKKDKAGWSIVAVTERGASKLTVTARYDDQDRLLGADATLTKGEQKSVATVTVADGKAKVERAGQPAKEFPAPPGLIITSAPDWSDIFLLCRRYDRKQGGKQTFTGLWIHPTEAPLLLPFTIEREGSDKIKHEGKEVELDRYVIRIRGPNPYVAWADEKGLVKLLPLPYKEGVPAGLVREDYKKSRGRLQPVVPD